MPALGPKGDDKVVEKKHASGFAGSALKSELDALGVDTVFLTGTSTSGCVRSSCIEGAALGFRMILVEEGSYEPRPLSGPVALSELADRYADVVSLKEATDYLESL
jgi:maleamate amidohydrolase